MEFGRKSLVAGACLAGKVVGHSSVVEGEDCKAVADVVMVVVDAVGIAGNAADLMTVHSRWVELW